MVLSRSHSRVLLWTGIGSAVAGVAVVITLMHRAQSVKSFPGKTLRDIQAVLQDCYRKIEEIDVRVSQLAEFTPVEQINE